MGFHNGAWWPIVVTDSFGPRCSQHPFDPYSLTHILHGFIFFLFLVVIPDLVLEVLDVNFPWWWMFIAAAAIAVALEVAWEIYENSERVVNRFRSTSGVSADYKGDSIQNSMGDVFCCSSGYWICVLSFVKGVPWLPLVWFVVSEVFLAITIRDGLVLIWIQLIFHSERIKVWQKEYFDRKQSEDAREE